MAAATSELDTLKQTQSTRSHLRALKILFVSSARDGGNWLSQLAKHLKARGHDVSVVVPGEGSLSRTLTGYGINVRTMPLEVAFLYSDRETFVNSVDSLCQYIEEKKFDVVEYCLFPALVVARLASFRCGVPSRVQLTMGPYNMESPILRLVEAASSWMETTVLATSRCIKRQYRSIFLPESRLPVIHFGHDHKRFNLENVERAASRKWLLETYGIPPDAPVVSMVSRFYAPLPDSMFIPRHLRGKSNKSHDLLIEAVPLVLNTVPDVRFLMVGGAWGEVAEAHVNSLKERCRELGIEERVIFTGNLDAIEKVNAATDVAVQCSNTENVCGAVVEALLMERAVVATDVGALNEPIVHGETGFLVGKDDCSALARYIVQLVKDPELRARLGLNGRRRMLEKHTLEVVIPQVEARYYRDLQKKPGLLGKLLAPHRKAIAAITLDVICHILALPYRITLLSQKRSQFENRILSRLKKPRFSS